MGMMPKRWHGQGRVTLLLYLYVMLHTVVSLFGDTFLMVVC